jgi:hypothetical protein
MLGKSSEIEVSIQLTLNLYVKLGRTEPLYKNYVLFSGLGIKTASYPTKCKQTPPSWNEKHMFSFITFLLEMTENQIYVLTRYTIFRFVSVYVACTTIL